jgi:hypothetical protein
MNWWACGHVYNLNTQQADAGGSLVPGQPGKDVRRPSFKRERERERERAKKKKRKRKKMGRRTKKGKEKKQLI